MGRAWIVLILLCIPSAAAVPGEVDLFVHMPNAEIFALHPSAPSDAADAYRGTGIGTGGHSVCTDAVDGPGLVGRHQRHSWEGHLTEGPVLYHEDGISTGMWGSREPLHFADKPLHATWALLVDDEAPIVPQVMVEVSLSNGTPHEIVYEGKGTVFATGATGPVDLHPDVDHPDVDVVQTPDGWVYVFHVPVPTEHHTFQAHDAFAMRVDAYVENALCSSRDGGTLMPDLVQAYRTQDGHPRLTVAMQEALVLDFAQMQPISDEVVFHLQATSPFGYLDTPPEHKTVTVIGPDGPVTLDRHAIRMAHHHSGPPAHDDVVHTLPNVSDLPPGEYQVQYRVANLQESAAVTATGRITVSDHVTFCNVKASVESCTTVYGDPEASAAGPLMVFAGLVLLSRRFSRRGQ